MRATRGASLVAGAALAVGAVLCFATPAQAHNYLVSSTPAEGENLTTLPEQFIITTNDALLDLGSAAGGFALQVKDAAGLYYGDGCVAIDGPSMTADAALGAPGDYTMLWQVVSIDGHTVSGEIPFSWAPTDATQSSEGSATAPVCGAATETPQSEPAPAPSDSAKPAETTTDEPASTDLLWIGGAAVAVLAAGAATLLVLSRKKR